MCFELSYYIEKYQQVAEKMQLLSLIFMKTLTIKYKIRKDIKHYNYHYKHLNRMRIRLADEKNYLLLR